MQKMCKYEMYCLMILYKLTVQVSKQDVTSPQNTPHPPTTHSSSHYLPSIILSSKAIDSFGLLF